MAKQKKPAKDKKTKPEGKSSESSEKASSYAATRETIESIAIAFALAFLFRTFVAEAFIIPTGSMSPSLMGAHKDVECEYCSTRFKVNSSTDGAPADQRYAIQAAAGMCPQCRHVMSLDEQVGQRFGDPNVEHENRRSYPGDRIVVSKFLYAVAEPERWDVLVFKYPGDAVQNYIKRLVGLPGEAIRVWQGDVFVKPHDESDDQYAIERKPPAKVLAMRQLVHDTDHDPVALYRNGFPLRWSGDEASQWKVETDDGDKLVEQTFEVAATNPAQTQWLRYRHIVADPQIWEAVNRADGGEKDVQIDIPEPTLISDFNSYNTRISLNDLVGNLGFRNGRGIEWRPREPSDGGILGLRSNRTGKLDGLAFPHYAGLHWVSDLHVEAEVEVESNEGRLSLQLVEAGHRFQCHIDVATGVAQLSIIPFESDEPIDSFAPSAESVVKNPGDYKIQFANVDDQLFLWIDDELMEFESPTQYDWEKLLGKRSEIAPKLGPNQTGDAAPVAIGATDIELEIDRLAVYRDIYYIADDSGGSDGISEFSVNKSIAAMNLPTAWHTLADRPFADFRLDEDQFFVMGDNSPQSSDARVWSASRSVRDGSQPAGPFVDRKLLVGRAVFVAWPHPWYYIPGTPIPVFPNFGDMRLIK